MQDKMTLPEYVIAPELGISLEVAEKIRKYHLFPMNLIRNELGHPIIVSKRSGYRHPDYEAKRNRTNSAHMFQAIPERQDPGWGAADYTVSPAVFYKFMQLLTDADIYNRLIFYPDNGFVHCDYRFLGVDRFYYVMRQGQLLQVAKSELLDVVWDRYVKL